MIRLRASVLCFLALALAVAGCGSAPKPVTKAEYQNRLQEVGADLTAAGSQLGKSIDIATFNQSVANFQKHLRDASKKLNGLKPPPDSREANKLLASSFHDLADELEPLKAARRKSITVARETLAKIGKSQAVADGRKAITKLRTLGYDTSQLGAL